MPQMLKASMLLALGTGTTLTFLSHHWFMAWLGLEINMCAILPLIMRHKNPRTAEAGLKYFLVQAAASGMLVLAMTLNAHMNKDGWLISHLDDQFAVALAVLALTTKLGMVPFHFWFPEVLQGLDYKTGLLMTTWQKLAPFALLIQITHDYHPYLLLTIGVVSGLVAGWAGINQTQLRKILAYSSMSHMGWMFVIMHFAPNVAIYALSIYILMVIAIFLLLMETQTTKIGSLTMIWTKGWMSTMLLGLILLSLAGLPPLTGFSPKLFILQELSKQDLPAPAFFLLISALLSLYFYIRLLYFSTVTLFPNSTLSKTSWRRKTRQDKVTLAIVATVATVTLPMIPFVMTITNLPLITTLFF